MCLLRSRRILILRGRSLEITSWQVDVGWWLAAVVQNWGVQVSCSSSGESFSRRQGSNKLGKEILFWSSFSSKPNVNQCKRFQIWTIRSGSISKLVDIEAAVEAAGTWKHIAEDEHHHQHGTWRCKCLNRSTCFPELSPRRRNWLDSLPRRNPDSWLINSDCWTVGLTSAINSKIQIVKPNYQPNWSRLNSHWKPKVQMNQWREGYLSVFFFVFAAGLVFFWVPGSMLSCFSAFLLLCFSAFCFFCFSACLLLCFSASAFLLFAFPASLLYLLLFFSASLLSLLLCFSAFVLLCLSTSTILRFSFLRSCVLLLYFLSLLPLCFYHFLLLYSLLFVSQMKP